MAIFYMMIGTNDLAKSRAFYDAVMPHLGGTMGDGDATSSICYNFSNGQSVWISEPFNGQTAIASNGSMPGFGCASKEEVDAAHAAALAHGGSNEGDPGPRPLYGPEFYGAYVRDPDGNKMCFALNT